MQIIGKSLIAGVVLRYALAMSGICVLAGCPDIKCENEVLREIVSPDTKYVATVFKRDCGATTSYAQIIMIREKLSEFRGDNKEEDIFTMNGLLDINVYWKDSRHLVIEPPDANAVFVKRESWRDIAISYGTK